jgi:hypothetical protein
MGWDIYFYKVKAQGANTTDIETLDSMRREHRKSLIPSEVRDEVANLTKSTPSEKDRARLIELLAPYTYYSFQKGMLETCELEKVAYWADDIIESFSHRFDMYYRKVNFLYAYFADRLENEQCLVTRHDVEDIIDRANKVLLAHDDSVSMELLPTQCGFFFGSTDYDDWYFADVKDCLTQMKKLNKSLNQDDLVMWEFSW